VRSDTAGGKYSRISYEVSDILNLSDTVCKYTMERYDFVIQYTMIERWIEREREIDILSDCPDVFL
jgi:hypothetical protein